MFTRIVEINAKSGKGRELVRVVNDKIMSILRDQPGFLDEITLASQENPDRIVALSFWRTSQDAEVYQRDVFPLVNDVIGNLIEGSPQVRTFDVASSTVHDIAVSKAA
jgi:heme-degrading monooxygenase HmoA